MVLHILGAIYKSQYFPSNYLVHIGVAVLALLVVRAFAQGKKTTWERDLHARTVLVTGGFTPLGLTLLQELAQRGAHIIALTPDPAFASPFSPTSMIIDLLRTTAKNEQIYAEHCDLSSPHSVRAFCTKFLTGKEQRLDAILFAHEYSHIGASSWFVSRKERVRRERLEDKKRESGSLATFLMTTLLLPALLVAPVERDIRILNLVNPFYAAAARPSFHVPNSSFPQPPSPTPTKSKSKPKPKSIILEESTRSLRTVILTRHLQRILDALPSSSSTQTQAQFVPPTDDRSSSVPVVNPNVQRSNIVAVSVSPGISRLDTVAPFMNADWSLGPSQDGGSDWESKWSIFGLVVYVLLQPLLRVLTKAPESAAQTVLHALFLPTPFKGVAQANLPDPEADADEDRPAPSTSNDQTKDQAAQPAPRRKQEVLKPGALYSECAVVQLAVPAPTPEQLEQIQKAKVAKAEAAAAEAAKSEKPAKGAASAKPKTSGGKGKGKSDEAMKEVLELGEDGEYGGEVAGRMVWEAYEDALKVWEKNAPPPPPQPESEGGKDSGKEKEKKATEDSTKSPYD